MLSKSSFANLGLAFLAAACLPIPSAAQVAAPAPAASAAAAPATIPVEPGEGRAVALKLADDLVSSFVFRDQAEAYAAIFTAVTLIPQSRAVASLEPTANM